MFKNSLQLRRLNYDNKPVAKCYVRVNYDKYEIVKLFTQYRTRDSNT